MRTAFTWRQRLRERAAKLLYTYMAALVADEMENSVRTIRKETCQEIASTGFLHFVNVSLFMEPEIPARHGYLLYFPNTEASIRRFVVTVGLIAMT
jgi:hypothetical protein